MSGSTYEMENRIFQIDDFWSDLENDRKSFMILIFRKGIEEKEKSFGVKDRKDFDSTGTMLFLELALSFIRRDFSRNNEGALRPKLNTIFAE